VCSGALAHALISLKRADVDRILILDRRQEPVGDRLPQEGEFPQRDGAPEQKLVDDVVPVAEHPPRL